MNISACGMQARYAGQTWRIGSSQFLSRRNETLKSAKVRMMGRIVNSPCRNSDHINLMNCLKYSMTFLMNLIILLMLPAMLEQAHDQLYVLVVRYHLLP